MAALVAEYFVEISHFKRCMLVELLLVLLFFFLLTNSDQTLIVGTQLNSPLYRLNWLLLYFQCLSCFYCTIMLE